MPTILKASVVAFLSCWFMYAAGQVTVGAECHNQERRWTFNSLAQSPCVLAAALAVCNGYRRFNLPALPPGFVYYGPITQTRVEESDCVCNTVFYSLLSACAYCQEHDWIPLSLYYFNCSSTTPTGLYFPNIPAEVRVPAWAYLPLEYDTFDPERARSLRGPESFRAVGATGTTSGYTLSLPTQSAR